MLNIYPHFFVVDPQSVALLQSGIIGQNCLWDYKMNDRVLNWVNNMYYRIKRIFVQEALILGDPNWVSCKQPTMEEEHRILYTHITGKINANYSKYLKDKWRSNELVLQVTICN